MRFALDMSGVFTVLRSYLLISVIPDVAKGINRNEVLTAESVFSCHWRTQTEGTRSRTRLPGNSSQS